PRWNLRWSRGQYSVRRNHTQLFLSRENCGSLLIPAMIETAAEAGYPIGGSLLRRVRCPRSEIQQERFVRSPSFLIVQPTNGIVSEIAVKQEIGSALRGVDGCRIAEQARMPLIGVGTHESIKVFKP